MCLSKSYKGLNPVSINSVAFMLVMKLCMTDAANHMETMKWWETEECPGTQYPFVCIALATELLPWGTTSYLPYYLPIAAQGRGTKSGTSLPLENLQHNLPLYGSLRLVDNGLE